MHWCESWLLHLLSSSLLMCLRRQQRMVQTRLALYSCEKLGSQPVLSCRAIEGSLSLLD